MAFSMSRRCLRLSLRAGERLPANLCWRIEQGHVWLARWSAGVDPLTLGVWGPGEVVIPALIGLSGLELRTLSPVVVEEEEASSVMEREFLEEQLRQAAILLMLSRVRPAEARLLQLLDWFGTRFGTMTSQGVMLTFGEKLLTHQQLADIAGMTRVTVTKALTSFRQAGVISCQAGGSLLLRVPCSEFLD
ncbi:Crp/Fnr family transcriptional regulator [Synechococcus sp. CS-1328]|uniref:Crp/Fnr family transcriptional regulator n=1 Tax=Synechococcus sp. CS-1328 TaxID=2847976 RepID=UPI00223AF76D|nr:Crp/Fnr family transcriptional regulator [Synechococcus sp. CS-1328]MCT0224884.1 Crp/Fnr family transcriptional regulator [Synechococcus sp. CS-1328]